MNIFVKSVFFLTFSSNLVLGYVLIGRTLGFYCQKEKNNSTPLEKLKQDLLCELDNYHRPVRDETKIVYITVKFTPIYYDVIEEQQIFRISGYIQMSWTDEFLKWQPIRYGGISEFTANYFDIWSPKITSYDMGTSYRFLDEMDKHRFEDSVIKSNGSVMLRSVSNLYGPCKYDTANWPFEEWNCVFSLSRTSDEEGHVLTNPFDPKTNIDISNIAKNNMWQIVSNPPFSLKNSPDSNNLEIQVTVQRYVSHYQNNFVFPGILLLFLSLASFWISSKICYRILINMLTTIVQISFLQRLFVLLEDNGTQGVALYNFYLDSMFISFISIFFAVLSAKLLSKPIDPPQYISEIIGIVASIPYIGPVFSYFINDDIDSPLTIDDDETGLMDGTSVKGSQKWRIVINFFDKCAFVLIILYLFFVYGLKILI